MKKYCLISFLLAISFSFFACKEDPAPVSQRDKVVPVKVPAINADSAKFYLEQQLTFGPRVPGTREHIECKDWLVSIFKNFGAEVIEQNFDARLYTGKTVPGTNIIAQINPSHRKRVLLSAHWDTRMIADYDPISSNKTKPIPGADDGASGVAVLIEIARTIQANPIDLGIDIVLFDAEDQGQSQGANTTWCLGSQYWSRNMHSMKSKPKYGILLDMVGAKAPRFARDAVSARYAPQILNKVWKLAQNMGYSDMFVNDAGGQITDDHFFVNTIAKIPMIDIINQPLGSETGFVPHWHTMQDDLSVIHKRTLRVVGQVVTAVLYKESEGSF